ncbi:alpha/beta fold hydrolase [Paludibaculum fermentans]|uniref:alpha/beta fold hydrolase n=1 Tax=Paludibaculum fermentans TaxID=1473598 RepID=UPI003EBAB36D
MSISKLVRAALLTALSFVMPAASFAAAPAVKTVLLVHGAWADGSSWSKVIPLLKARGFHVVSVQIPLTSLDDDVAATKRALALESGPLLLVGHSYGGVVISQAGNDPKVAGLVFVAAYAPDEGQSGMSLAEMNPTPVGSHIGTPDEFGFLKLTRTGIFQDFAPGLSNTEKSILFATQIPTSVNSLAAPLPVAPAWKTKPNWFIVASRDQVISPQLEESEALQMNATTLTLPSCHVVMLEDPFPVARFIVDAAETLSH